MVETDDFLQNCSVLEPMVCKPGGLLSVRCRDEALTGECSVVDLYFLLKSSKIQVVLIEDRLMVDQLLSKIVHYGKFGEGKHRVLARGILPSIDVLPRVAGDCCQFHASGRPSNNASLFSHATHLLTQ